jgi:EAL domain-containing protein (putative c-di-GMP-specific phosphodiesterase class I)
VVCLKLAGCDVAQGYHFSRPLSAAQLTEYPPFANAAASPTTYTDVAQKVCVP